MAGDWIKMRTNLDTNPRVLQLADALQVPPLHVVGMLWKLWSWADAHSLDGNTLGVTDVTLDRFVDRPGFAAELRHVGWLEGRGNALSFPRFDQHNGQTAKNRAETKDRVRRHRNAEPVTDVTTPALPEKRREEKKKSPPAPTPPTPSGAAATETGEPPPAGEREIRQVLVRAKHLGCDFPGKAAREAVRLCGLQHVHELLDFAEDRAIRGADLHGRLERATPDLAPTAGWDSVQPATPRSKADEMARLKATWGKAIEQMPVDQFRAYALEGVNAGLRGMVREDRRPKEIEAAWIAVAKILDERRAG